MATLEPGVIHQNGHALDDGINTVPPADDMDELEDGVEFPANADEEEEEPLFSPPLYIQRYCFVESEIDSQSQVMDLKSLVDLGCAELHFLSRAKNGRVFERIIGVDTDEFLVGSNCRRLQPGVYDIANPREKPLRVEVFAGNAGEPDPRIVDIDVVTAIELIEHMDESTHESLIINVFDVIQPKLAVFTTPNVEYNPLFPDGSVDKRRHWDHRFEWTRGQFQAWCKSIATRYPYSVRFGGVGLGPEDTQESHGYCSQIAVFCRDSNVPRLKRLIQQHNHKLIRKIEYPWEPPKTIFEQLLDNIEGDCYIMAKELQDLAEQEGRYNEEWFHFSAPKLYDSSWRLQNVLKDTADPLESVRLALQKSTKEWLAFSVEKDEVSYKLQSAEETSFNHGDDEENVYTMGMDEEDDLVEITLNTLSPKSEVEGNGDFFDED